MTLVQNLEERKVILLEMPASLLYALKVLTCSRSLEGGPEGGITGTIIRILREFRDSKSHDLGFKLDILSSNN